MGASDGYLQAGGETTCYTKVFKLEDEHAGQQKPTKNTIKTVKNLHGTHGCSRCRTCLASPSPSISLRDDPCDEPTRLEPFVEGGACPVTGALTDWQRWPRFYRLRPAIAQVADSSP